MSSWRDFLSKQKISSAPLKIPVGKVNLGDLAKAEPVSKVFGFDRGLPIDRYYIESFISSEASMIRGDVLEIGGDEYSRKFGPSDLRITILHAAEAKSANTIVADLTEAAAIQSDSFDCIICTQTLHVIYDFRAALRTIHRILKPGGTLLATLPGISQISRHDMDRWGDYWRFTSLSAQKVFEETFGKEAARVSAFGNVLSATAFLQGLAAEELNREQLETRDPDYEVTIAVKGRKV